LSVTAAVLQSIAVTPTDPSIAAGTTQQFTATGTFSNSTTQDLTASAIWSSSDTVVANIDSTSGKAIAVGAGSTAITATSGGKTGATTLTVTPLIVTGTWIGTYTIYDDPTNPSQIGTYSFQFVLNQNGTSVTGEATLRGNTPNQLSVTAQLTGNVTGQQMNFSFIYYSPQVPENLLTDIGTAIIADNTMTGNVIENFQTRYNCSYIFTLTKTP
jgi:uncharacterized protein YjdB